MCGKEQLQWGREYRNTWNESYQPTAFKFYVSGFHLIDRQNRLIEITAQDNYFLIDLADSASSVISVTAPPGNYSGIGFSLGVDSLHNVSGAQTGALDPMKGMFWTWNSGYVNAKLEGTSSSSNQPGHIFEYHIGGYRTPNDVQTSVQLSFPSGNLQIAQNAIDTWMINADINTWFKGPLSLKIGEAPVCTTPGVFAKQISLNYVHMFSVEPTQNK